NLLLRIPWLPNQRVICERLCCYNECLCDVMPWPHHCMTRPLQGQLPTLEPWTSTWVVAPSRARVSPGRCPGGRGGCLPVLLGATPYLPVTGASTGGVRRPRVVSCSSVSVPIRPTTDPKLAHSETWTLAELNSAS